MVRTIIPLIAVRDRPFEGITGGIHFYRELLSCTRDKGTQWVSALERYVVINSAQLFRERSVFRRGDGGEGVS